MQALQQKAFVSGTAVQAKARVAAKARSPVVVRAQKEEVCRDRWHLLKDRWIYSKRSSPMTGTRKWALPSESFPVFIQL